MTTKLTQEGLSKLEAELKELKAKREVLITRIEEVAQPDESGEDGLAVQLKEELEIVNAKIDQIETALESVEILGAGNGTDFIDIGSRVTIKIADNNAQITFDIVNEFEADPTANKISDKSPLGQALIGKKINQHVDFEAPVGKMTYRIVEINPIV